MFALENDLIQFVLNQVECEEHETPYSFFLCPFDIRSLETVRVSVKSTKTKIERDSYRFNVVQSESEDLDIYYITDRDELENDYLNRPNSTLVEVDIQEENTDEDYDYDEELMRNWNPYL